MESVDWKVHVEVRGGNKQAAEETEQEGSSSETRKKKKKSNGIAPKAVLQLSLQDQSKMERETKTVSVEFNREQLEKLYKNFEEIQSQLDALT